MAQAKLNNGSLGRDTDTFTHDERVEFGRKGGIASGKSRRMKKQMRETLYDLLYIPLKKGKKKETEDLKNLQSASEANLDAQTMMMLSIIKKAIRGDVVAATFIRDTLGENPFVLADKEKQQIISYEDEEQETLYLEDLKTSLLNRKIEGVDDE